jgi:hypothetical protein
LGERKEKKKIEEEEEVEIQNQKQGKEKELNHLLTKRRRKEDLFSVFHSVSFSFFISISLTLADSFFHPHFSVLF